MTDWATFDKMTARVAQVANRLVWSYSYGGSGKPGPEACRSIAFRIMTIMHGKVMATGEPTTNTKEYRPYYGNTSPEYATDPEPGYKMSESASYGSNSIYVDLKLRLQYHLVDGSRPRYASSIVVSSIGEFQEDQQFCILYRGEGHLSSIYSNADFRKDLINEFDLMPHLERLAKEFQIIRGGVFEIAKLAAEKHGKKLERTRAKQKTKDFQEKRTDNLRKKAQERLSTELLKGTMAPAFSKFTPEQFFELYKLAESHYSILAELKSWQGRNPSASNVVTLEDVKLAYDLASVKVVMEA